jgi:hypothetical protein
MYETAGKNSVPSEQVDIDGVMARLTVGWFTSHGISGM